MPVREAPTVVTSPRPPARHLFRPSRRPPLRLCPRASVPSDVVSRCTGPAGGPRTSRAADTISRGGGVRGHSRSDAVSFTAHAPRSCTGGPKCKRPGSFRNPGLCEERLEGARLVASLTRRHRALVPTELPKSHREACGKGLMRGGAAGARRGHRRGAHERNRTPDGSGGSDGVPGYHDEASRRRRARLSDGGGM